MRLAIAPPDAFSPPDTLTSAPFALPPPRATPIVPSHPESNVPYPAHMLPANPERTGLLSSLVHQIRLPTLPPLLRERLTALRPPAPHKAVPGFGDAMRGPSEAALARARGKSGGTEAEVYLRAVRGTRARAGWTGRGGKLPVGRKVIRSGEGEVKPRGLDERPRADMPVGSRS